MMLEQRNSGCSSVKPLVTSLIIFIYIICYWSSHNLLLAEVAAVHYHKWEISYQFKSPDCYKRLAVTITGETPGPTINAQQGDTVVVQVKNSLLIENVAIHWHGIRQIGTPWFDGTEGVTQCPILPGDTFVYRFVVDTAGTYLYHAHYGMQRSAGLYGLIRVVIPAGVVEPFNVQYHKWEISYQFKSPDCYKKLAVTINGYNKSSGKRNDHTTGQCSLRLSVTIIYSYGWTALRCRADNPVTWRIQPRFSIGMDVMFEEGVLP